MPFCRERTARAQRRLRATPSSHGDSPSNRPHHASQSVTSVRLAGHVSCKYARATPLAQRHDRLSLRRKSLRVTRVRYVASSGDVIARRRRSRTRVAGSGTVHVDASQDTNVRCVSVCKTASDTSQRKYRRAKRISREPGGGATDPRRRKGDMCAAHRTQRIREAASSVSSSSSTPSPSRKQPRMQAATARAADASLASQATTIDATQR